VAIIHPWNAVNGDESDEFEEMELTCSSKQDRYWLPEMSPALIDST
jgi:hypothetical protein